MRMQEFQEDSLRENSTSVFKKNVSANNTVFYLHGFLGKTGLRVKYSCVLFVGDYNSCLDDVMAPDIRSVDRK